MLISVSEASKRWGVARTTIYRNIKNGKLSSRPDGKIDHAEMLRFFGEPKVVRSTDDATDNNEALKQRSDAMQQQVEALQKHIDELKKSLEASVHEKEWLRAQVDKAQETIKLLEHLSHQTQEHSHEKPRKGLFGRLIGAVLDE